MFIPLEEEGVEGKEEDLRAWNCRLIQIINDDNDALFYHVFVHCKGERREKRKGVKGWNCSVFK